MKAESQNPQEVVVKRLQSKHLQQIYEDLCWGTCIRVDGVRVYKSSVLDEAKRRNITLTHYCPP